MTLLAVHDWPDNAALVEDIAAHGRYLHDRLTVLDVTYGHGRFWTRWQPPLLVASDADPSKGDWSWDFTRLPMPDGWCDVVVFDPPYKLNGTPDDEMDERYGVHVPARWQDRMTLIERGVVECCRVACEWVLVKCQDQVCSGKMRWQTDLVTRAAESVGWRKVDRFDLTGHARPQPSGRRQVHAFGRGSTLIVLGAS